ncbi:S26 family signal peptidase [Candidatus Nanohalococcus occultus]|uniref:S26 family signal peptidase n=1 Tax=Candidatus Nanohalococcus occultus TaxID=2978047 RepID=UPI0039E15FAB
MGIKRKAKLTVLAALVITGGSSLLLSITGDSCTTRTVQTVQTDSLSPIIAEGENVTVLENYYTCNAPERTENIYYQHASRQEPLLLNVTAVPGDHMSFSGCELEINNQTVRNSAGEAYCLEGKRKGLLELYTGKLSGYLLLSENSSGGYDSTRFGIVSEKGFESRVKSRNKFLGLI